MPEHSNIPKETAELPKKAKIKFGKIILWTISSILLLIVVSIFVLFLSFPDIPKAVYNFAIAPANQISSSDNKINLLVMGKSGGLHEGSDLTDTMMVVSISLADGGIKTVSIPRDVWVPELMAKINSAYYWGKNGSAYFSLQDTGGGISFAKRITGKIIGQPIQYGIVIDFSAFKDLVDSLGGISVDVERPFVDDFYPIEGKENDLCDGDTTYTCRYETVIFDSGVQHMDGETALKFVRSRHAEGDEGTDLAREARQQKVVEAIKEKILQPKTYMSVKDLRTIISVAEKYVETDIDLPTAGILGRKVIDNINNITQYSIPEDLLVVPPTSKIYDNLYVFIPKAGNGNWQEIQKWFSLNF